MEEAEVKPLIGCSLAYERNGEKHDKTNAVLFPDSVVFSAPGFSSTVKLNTIDGVHAKDYRVYIRTSGGDITLSMIGHLYEDFASKFIRAYNEVVFGDSLMEETVHFEADGQYVSPESETSHAVFRICETALVILPDTHGLLRIPLSMIANTNLSPYRFEITDKLGRRFVIQKLGQITDPFMRAYKTRLAQLIKQTRERLGEISPAGDTLAALLMEGMVAKLSDVRKADARFADAIDGKLASSDISQEYGYLKSVSSDLAIGIKRGLMGELTGESIFVLAPVFDKNIMFMESLGDTAAATYAFKLSPNGTFPAAQWDDFLLSFNYSMLSVNFRREPIYLSGEALKAEKYEQYGQALRRVPGLSKLRESFAGRVIHSGFESWKKAMDSYIK